MLVDLIMASSFKEFLLQDYPGEVRHKIILLTSAVPRINTLKEPSHVVKVGHVLL